MKAVRHEQWELSLVAWFLHQAGIRQCGEGNSDNAMAVFDAVGIPKTHSRQSPFTGWAGGKGAFRANTKLPGQDCRKLQASRPQLTTLAPKRASVELKELLDSITLAARAPRPQHGPCRHLHEGRQSRHSLCRREFAGQFVYTP